MDEVSSTVVKLRDKKFSKCWGFVYSRLSKWMGQKVSCYISRCGDSRAASCYDEFFSDVVIALKKTIEDYDPDRGASFKTFFFRRLRNSLRDTMTRLVRTKAVSLSIQDSETGEEVDNDLFLADNRYSDNGDFDTQLTRQTHSFYIELARKYAKVFNDYEPIDRMIIKFYCEEKLLQSEIVVRLGLSKSSLSNRINFKIHPVLRREMGYEMKLKILQHLYEEKLFIETFKDYMTGNTGIKRSSI